MYKHQEITLLNPQLMILGAMQHFHRQIDLQALVDSENIHSEYPLLFQWRDSDKANYPKMAVLPWDTSYNMADILSSEEDSTFLRDLQPNPFQASKGRIYCHSDITDVSVAIENTM